jgi:hypothetical protein
VERRPTLLETCARAATAAEARFRIGYPNSARRASRVIALDGGAAAMLARFADQSWSGARRLIYVSQPSAAGLGSRPIDVVVRAPDGSDSLLADELAGVDIAVMIASAAGAAEAAAVVADACAARGIMTAGLVFGALGDVGAAISALRPHASVLVVSRDQDFVPEMLAALRA